MNLLTTVSIGHIWIAFAYSECQQNQEHDPKYKVQRYRDAVESDYEFSLNKELIYNYERMKSITEQSNQIY